MLSGNEKKNRFQLYAQAYVCIWKLHSCIYFNENSSKIIQNFTEKGMVASCPLGQPLNPLMNADH